MKRPRKALALLAAMAVAVPLVCSAPSAATAPPPGPATETGSGRVAQPTGPAAGATVTLLTGDRVRLDRSPDGTPRAEVVYDAGPQDDIVFQQVNDDFYALTGEVVRLIGNGRLDRELFNVSRLVRERADDAHSTTVPVIADYGAPTAREPVAPRPVPKGATRIRTLASIGAQALRVDKGQTGGTWSQLVAGTGPRRLWLDGQAKAMLDVSVPAIGAAQMWQAGYDGRGMKVAVLDTGIDADHADFAGRIVASRSFVPGEAAQDGHGHGTHVASIVAGSGATAAERYRGVAPNAQLVVGKVLGNGGSGSISGIIEGMEWAAAQGAKVVNMSLGAGPSNGNDPLSEAVNRISAQTGALFVIAAGNQYGAPMSVTTPAAADRALAVGNVTKRPPYSSNGTSSIGPRQGDFAIKPEITAPGTDIVAAQAAGTDLNPDDDPDYMSLSGTSMASPHVAGAAVLLAQQHPDWTAGQLKDALVSSANPNPATPVTWQGGGMVDLRRASSPGLVATGTAYLGVIEPPYAETLSGTVTLRNTSGAPIHADLTPRLFQSDSARRLQTPYSPPAGAVTVEPAAVDVPAGGSVTVRLTVRPGQLEIASYYGWLEAVADATVLTRTTIGWTKDVAKHQLKVRAVDRSGVPAHTTYHSFGVLINQATETEYLAWFENGVGHFARQGEDLGTDPRLPAGRYVMLAHVAEFTPTAPYSKLSETLGGDPDLVLDRDRTLTLDARQGKRLRIETPRPAEPNLGDGVEVHWTRGFGEGQRETFRWSEWLQANRDVYVLPTPRNTTGSFTATFGARLVAPDLTMRATGTGTSEVGWLDAEYARWANAGDCARLDRVRCVSAFASPGRYPVVDAGTGTAAELAAAGVRGKLALVREVHDPDAQAITQYPLQSLAAAATAAGATGVLYAIADPGPAERWSRRSDIPVAVLPQAQGARLAQAVRAGAVTIHTGGQPTSPYVYDLIQAEQEALPADPVYDIKHDQVATVTARYHADTPGQVYQDTRTGPGYLYGLSKQTRFAAPFTRTEYLTAGVRWRHNLDFGESPYQSENGKHTYAAGAAVTEDHVATPMTPGATTGTTMVSSQKWVPPSGGSSVGRLQLPGSCVLAGEDRCVNRFVTAGGFAAMPNRAGYPPVPPGEVRLTYRQGDRVLCDFDGLRSCEWTDPQPGPHRISLDTTNVIRPVSTATHTDWTVNANFGVAAPAAVPLVQLGYDVPVELTNSVRPGASYPITVSPDYQAGYSGSGQFAVQAWVSHDRGASWTSLGSEQAGAGGAATFTAIPAQPGARSVSLRVRATDAAGNAVDQTITDAWLVSPQR